MSMQKTLCKMRVSSIKLKLTNIYITTTLVSSDLLLGKEKEANQRLHQIHDELNEAFKMLETLSEKLGELEVK